MRHQSGINLLEMLIALVLVTILFIPMIDLLNRSFITEYKNRLNVETKEARDSVLNRMTSVLKSASYIHDGSLNVPTPMGASYISSSYNGTIVFVPQIDENTGDIKQEGDYVVYDAYAYGLIDAYMFSDDFDYSNYEDKVLVESYKTIKCAPLSNEVRTPDTTDCDSGYSLDDWGESGITNPIYKKVKPGQFDYYSTSFNKVNDRQMELAFASKEGQMYYSAGWGDYVEPKYIHSVDINLRNVP